MDVVSYQWRKNKWARGCPVAIYGVGQKIPFSAVLRDARGVSLRPHHLVHLAGTPQTKFDPTIGGVDA